MANTTAKGLLFNPKSLNVRLEEELHERLKAAAKRELRSVNAEIAHRVRVSLDNEAQAS
jgi:predicted HicB family RNase H-like nuclease